MNKLNEYGSWHVNDQIYYDKILALQAAAKSNCLFSDITYKFHDEEFDKHDWTTPTEKSLSDLYLARALELRNKYDYLALFYSGGHDSHNILDTFAKNKIHLDEVIIRGTNFSNLNENKPDIYSLDIECNLVALPLAKFYKENFMPHLKISFHDNTQKIKKFWQEHKNVYNLGHLITDPTHAVRYDFNRYFLENKNNKKIGYMIGVEKPVIKKDNIGYYFYISDDNIYRQIKCSNVLNQNSFGIEMFYWSKNTAPLIIKQCHTIVDYVNKFGGEHYIESSNRNPYFVREQEDFYASIIYQRQHNILTDIPKSNKLLWDTGSDWFVKDKDSNHYKNFMHHLWDWRKELSPFFQDFKGFVRHGIKSIPTRPRYFKYF